MVTNGQQQSLLFKSGQRDKPLVEKDSCEPRDLIWSLSKELTMDNLSSQLWFSCTYYVNVSFYVRYFS